MLEVNNLVVHYGRLAALRGITLNVIQGEIVGLIGPNGAGKTTTLMTIMGLRHPTEGAVTFQGRRLHQESPEQIVRRGISLVPEGRRIFGSLTVHENLLLGGITRAKDAVFTQDIARILDRFPVLNTYRRSPAGRLSGGEQQQLAIARALLSKPRLLVLDEPSLGLAPRIVDLVFDILGELRDEGMTILLVEQAARRAVEFADRSYVLRSGRIELEGDKQKYANLPAGKLERAFLGIS